MVRYCWRASTFNRCHLRDGYGANLDCNCKRWIYNFVRGCGDASASTLANLAQNVRANVDKIAFALDSLVCDFNRLVSGSQCWT